LKKWVKDKKEVEIVDLVLTIRKRLQTLPDKNSDASFTLSSETKRRLHCQLTDLVSSLPEDLRDVLITSWQPATSADSDAAADVDAAAAAVTAATAAALAECDYRPATSPTSGCACLGRRKKYAWLS